MMKILVVGIFVALFSSCTLQRTVHKGTDPLGADVTVYRDADGKITKQIRDMDSLRVVYYYK